MRTFLTFTLLIVTIRATGCTRSVSSEEELVRSLDDEARSAALARDVTALERLWSEQLFVNAPNNEVVVGRDAVIRDFVLAGVINFSRFDRQIEHVRLEGDFAFVMGAELVEPVADAPSSGLFAGQLIERRFTNIWRKEAGTWRLFARHANVVSSR
jgi:ketosteroid isomerase-like protein